MSEAPDRDVDTELLTSFSAVVLAGGQGARLGGVDKAGIEVAGRTLLTHVLDAVLDAAEVVVVGEQVPTERPVTFVLESPRLGGPVAGLLTGVAALLRHTPAVAVVAVDMPHLSPDTFRRLHAALGRGATSGRVGRGGEAPLRDGAVLVDPDGRRQLALLLRRDRLDAVRPGYEEQHGMPLRDLLAPLDLVEVPSLGREHRDVDTWGDLRDVSEG